MTFDQLVEAVRKILPDAAFEYDNEGQIVIYTSLAIADDGENLKEFEPED